MPIFIPCLFQLVCSQEAFTLHLGAVHEYYQTEERRRIKKIQNGTNLLVSLSFIGIRVSSVELSVVFSVEKMSVEKNMTLNSTINNTKFFLKNNVLPQSLLLLMRLAWIFAKRSKKVCPSWLQGQKTLTLSCSTVRDVQVGVKSWHVLWHQTCPCSKIVEEGNIWMNRNFLSSGPTLASVAMTSLIGRIQTFIKFFIHRGGGTGGVRGGRTPPRIWDLFSKFFEKSEKKGFF